VESKKGAVGSGAGGICIFDCRELQPEIQAIVYFPNELWRTFVRLF
jgi:hypothetical protein